MGNGNSVIICNEEISAMRAHPSDAKVQENGCAAMANLAANINNQVAIAAIAAAGGIEAAISAMWAHPSNARVQEKGCDALWSLAINSNNQVAIAAAGGIEAVISAMRAHPSDAKVQERGGWAFYNLANNSYNNQVAIAAAGGIEAVISAMQAYPSDALVYASGCGALLKLAANSNNKVTIVAAGGIVAVTSGMHLVPSIPTCDPKVPNEALSILAANTNGQVTIAAAPNAGVQQCGSLLENSAVERGEFFDLLLAADTNSSTVSTYALLEMLRPEVRNCQELILFYTIANGSFKKEQITLGQRNDFLKSVLEAVPKTFQFDEESRVVAMLRLVLDKAMEDNVIDKSTHYRLEESYTKENVLADYRFLSLMQIVQQHGARLYRVEAVAKSIDSRQKYLDNRQKGQAIVHVVCSLISIFGGIFAESLGLGSLGLGAEAEMVGIDSIVDFSDTAHIQELIVVQIGTMENDKISALANESNITDLCNCLTNTSDQDLLPLIGILKVSQNLSGADLSEPDSSLIRPHEAILPVSIGILKVSQNMSGPDSSEPDSYSTMSSPHVLVIDPESELKFTLSHNEATPRCVLTLRHPGTTDEHLAFKVKTTQPRRYLVRPNQGLIAPDGSETISILLVEEDKQILLQSYERLGQSGLDHSKDKFLVQSCVVSSAFASKAAGDSNEMYEALTTMWNSVTSGGSTTPLFNKKLHVRHVVQDSDQDLLPLIGILKVSQNLSGPDSSEPDSYSSIRPHEASLPVLVILAKIRLSHHGDLLLENGIEMAEDLKDLSREQAQSIGVTKVGELNRLKRWQESF